LHAAQDLENRVKRAASGWEADFHIVIDGIIRFEDLIPLIKEFEQQGCGTRIRISQEILSGVWESLITGRADLAIGAAYDGPDAIRMQGEFQTRSLGNIDWVFAVAPEHPLANATEPLSHAVILEHRAVAVGDTSLTLPSMTAGLLSGTGHTDRAVNTSKTVRATGRLGLRALTAKNCSTLFAVGHADEKRPAPIACWVTTASYGAVQIKAKPCNGFYKN
jgi:DNA-binding transcriptional LysR family regulator